LRQGFQPVAVGIIAGLGGAVLVAFAMRNLLFEVEPVDRPTFAAIPVMLAAISLLACLIPARKATRVDPLVALRTE